jgi:hypothetical protein
MSLYLLFGIVAGIWLLSIVPAVLVLRWSFLAIDRRFVLSLILSLTALVITSVALSAFALACAILRKSTGFCR